MTSIGHDFQDGRNFKFHTEDLFLVQHICKSSINLPSLTDCGLVMPYEDINVG